MARRKTQLASAMKNAALAYVGQSRSQTAMSAEASTLFGQFMQAVLSLQHEPRSSGDRQSALCDMPLEVAIAEGLVPVLKKVADSYRLPFNTTANVLEHVIPGVDRVIGVGLLLVHATPGRAAATFIRDVVATVDSNAAALKSGAVTDFADVVVQPVARFFADLLQQVSAYRKRAELLRDSLSQSNTFQDEPLLQYVDVHGRLPNLRDQLAYMDIAFVEQKGVANDKLHVRQRIRLSVVAPQSLVADKLELPLRALLYVQSVLRQLPVQHRDIPRTLLGYDVDEQDASLESKTPRTIEREWMYTQILLSAISAPADAEVLSGIQYVAAVPEIDRLSDDEIVERFIYRMGQRGMKPLAVEHREILIKIIKDRLGHIRNDLEYRSTSTRRWRPDSLVESAFVLGDLTEISPLTHEEALSYAAADVPISRGTQQIKPTREELMQSIDWKRVSVDDVEKLIGIAVLSTEQIISGIRKIPSRYRSQAAEAVFNYLPDTSPHVEILFNKGLLVPTVNMLLHRWNAIPSAYRIKPLEELIDDCRSKNERLMSRLSQKRGLLIFRSIPEKELKRLFESDVRLTLIEFVSDCISESQSMRDSDLAEQIKQGLLELGRLLGMEIWSCVVFADYHFTRVIEFREGLSAKNRKGLKLLPKWEELANTANDPQAQELVEWLGVTSRDAARKYLREISEEDILRWLVIDSSASETAVRKFRRDRARYYANDGVYEKATPVKATQKKMRACATAKGKTRKK